MWRMSSAVFSSSTHPIDGAGLVRLQLSTAVIAGNTGEVPPIAVLVGELLEIAAIVERTAQLPFENRPNAPFKSISADLRVAMGRAAPRLRALVEPALTATIDPAWPSDGREQPPAPWAALLEAARSVETALRDPDTLASCLDDALEAASAADNAAAIAALRPALNDLYGVAEFQQRSWSQVRETIRDLLTLRHADENGHVVGGRIDGSAPPEEVHSAMREALGQPVSDREYAVWIATLAGPGIEHEPDGPAVVNGPVASSRAVCSDDVGAWLTRVRHGLLDAFVARNVPVPADVQALGQPVRYRGNVVETGEELWSNIGTPPSFVTRVAVSATHSAQAIERAFTAVRAVFGFSSPELAQSLRADAVLWTTDGGWWKPGTTARGLSLGELSAPRRAAAVVDAWADELGDPLDPAKLDVLSARSLVANDAAPAEVRLLRAFMSLESLTPAGQSADQALERLVLRDALHHTRASLLHILDRSRSRSALWPPAEHASPDALSAGIARLEAHIAGPNSPGWSLGLLDAVDELLEDVDQDGFLPALSRLLRTHLNDPRALAEAQADHTRAIRRARRHRNLATHGHYLSEMTLMPTVQFLALQLELAVAALADEATERARRGFGSLTTRSNVRPTPETLADLIRAKLSHSSGSA